MSYAINPQGGWRAIDTAQDLLSGEKYSETQPAVPAPDPKDVIRAQINALLQENGLMQPWQVESAMAGMLAYASNQGVSEPMLYAGNPGYKTAKDLDAQIKALQAQL